MAPLQQKLAFQAANADSPISPAESARYTADILDSLRKIATQQGQAILAHLLELAQMEARMVVRDAKTPDAP
jgi:hypothetical protein